MSQFITVRAADLFIENAIKFENKNINTEYVTVELNDAKFGIINLQTITKTVTEQEQEFIFMIDCSGSMSDMCSDKRSKMQHIIHTLKNMILYFKENSNIKIHISIYAFDDHIFDILDRSPVTNENFAEIIQKVDSIIPRDSTNIEIALSKVRECANKIKTDYPNSNICHIFMTDGEVTTGEKTAEILSELVDRTITNAFIGFGIEHDADLLETLGTGEKTNYYFVDKLENSGLVYGEILHDILYKFMSNVRFTVQNGLIYDFKKNIWSETLNVGEIVSEANKIYHIASNKAENCFVTITGTIDSEQNFELIISTQEEPQDLTKYIYRQRTLQNLYSVKNFIMRKKNRDYDDDYDTDEILFSRIINNYNIFCKEENAIKQCLQTFMKEMKKYMKDNNLCEDKFMKNLCDDIFICYRTFNTKFGNMYVNARQSSQGSQRYYAVRETPHNCNLNDNGVGFDDELASSSMPESFPGAPKLKRQKNNYIDDNNTWFDLYNININNHNLNLDDVNLDEVNLDDVNLDDVNLDDENFEQHEMSKIDDDPYLTPNSTQIMREISNTRNIVLGKEKEKLL
jgi:hypothetical protein